jgi:spore maturation protein CgeB
VKIVLLVHSVLSDWNNGHAHFLRGLMRALMARGHDVVACEPRGNWSSENLFRDHGAAPFLEYAQRFPDLSVAQYDAGAALIEQLDTLTRDAGLVIVHEFNEPDVLGAAAYLRRRRRDFALLFHDTHHRAVSAPEQIARLNLAACDGVLAFGRGLCEVYRRDFGVRHTWVLHEAADLTTFRPFGLEPVDDVVWIGNWGDEERSAETRAYVLAAARTLPRLRFAVHGVRYPAEAISALEAAGVAWRGWLPNWRVPEALGRARMTLHIPRSPYREALAGIPTIRPFEALACGTPLVCVGWRDAEGLFRPGRDYLAVDTPAQAYRTMERLAGDAELRARLSESGLETIRARHTCGHRAEQLLEIHATVARQGS